MKPIMDAEQREMIGRYIDMLDTDGSPDAYRDMTPVGAREGDGYGLRMNVFQAIAVFAFAFFWLGFVAAIAAR